MVVDAASPDTSFFDATTVRCSLCPSDQDLNRLTRTLRSTARARNLPDQVAERYEAWIFLFLGWCLQAPPGQVHRDRVGDFWTALTQRQVPRWKVCEAMDAVGFLFGALGGAEALFISEASEADAFEPHSSPPDSLEARPSSEERNTYRPNPTLRASASGGPGQAREGKALSSYLPEGRLPMGVDARAAVPTAESIKTQMGPSASSEEPASLEGTTSSDSPSSGPKTLFNPEGQTGADDEKGTAPKTLFPQDDAWEEEDPPQGHCDENREAAEQKASQPGCPDASEGAAGSQPQYSETSDEEAVPIPIPEPVADRVKKAARQLGLPPRIFAARALDLVCDEIGIERSDSPPSEAPLERYQAQLDVLHLGKRAETEHAEEVGGLETGEREHTGESDGAGEAENSDGAEGTGENPDGEGRFEIREGPSEQGTVGLWPIPELDKRPERSDPTGGVGSGEKEGAAGKDGSVGETPFLSL